LQKIAQFVRLFLELTSGKLTTLLINVKITFETQICVYSKFILLLTKIK